MQAEALGLHIYLLPSRGLIRHSADLSLTIVRHCRYYMLDHLPHFWINRHADASRRERAQAYFDAGSVHHQRIEAIVPQTLPNVRVRIPFANSRPELAILTSHLDAIAASLRVGLPAVIMEDDVRSNYVFDAAALLASAPPDWEVLQLHISNAQVVAELGQLYLQHGVLWHEWEPQCYSAGAYVVNRRGAERILGDYRSHPPEVNLTGVHAYGKLVADHLLYRRSRTYSTTVPFFYNDMTFSSTHAGHRDNTHHRPGAASVERVMQAVAAKVASDSMTYPFAIRAIAPPRIARV